MRDRCIVTSAAVSTWRNVDAVDIQLLAIEHLFVPDEDRLTVEGCSVIDKWNRVFD